MTPTLDLNGKAKPNGLPRDIRNWLTERELSGAVYLSQQELTSEELHRLPPGPVAFNLPPMTLLTVITWSYAAGILESENIVNNLLGSKELRYLCANAFPDNYIIRRFRRQHRDLIQKCLSRVLFLAWTWHYSQSRRFFS